MIAFQTSVRVKRPIEEVFAFVSDPVLFPRWNSAVQTVHRTSEETGTVRSTYSMQRQLPTGQVENELEVLAREHPTGFAIRTTSGPTPFRCRLAGDGVDTVIQLDARRRAVRRGVGTRAGGGAVEDVQVSSGLCRRRPPRHCWHRGRSSVERRPSLWRRSRPHITGSYRSLGKQ
jgi:hypothetical protein